MSQFNFENFNATVNFMEAYKEKVELSGNPIVDMSQKVKVIPMPIEVYLSFYEKCIVAQKTQRDHEYRMSNSKKTAHITNPDSFLSQVDVVVSFYDNQFWLTDGNHRSMHWYKAYSEKEQTKGNTMTLPSTVYVHLKYFTDAENEAYNKLYYTYDCKQSLKGTNHAIQGAFRQADLQFTSSLFKEAAFTKTFKELDSDTYGNPGENFELVMEAATRIVAKYKTGLIHTDALLTSHGLQVGSKKPMGLNTLIVAGIIGIFNSSKTEQDHMEAHNFCRELLIVAKTRTSAQGYTFGIWNDAMSGNIKLEFVAIRNVLQKFVNEKIQGKSKEYSSDIFNAFKQYKSVLQVKSNVA